MERSPPTSGRPATPADINRNGRPASIGTGGRYQSECPAGIIGIRTFAALMDGRTILDLAEGLQLRRVRVMGANRIELSGFNDTTRDRLKAYGLFHEIISWRLRMFVPTDATGAAILARLLGRYPVERIGEREAA
jgi:hypothetical protein